MRDTGMTLGARRLLLWLAPPMLVACAVALKSELDESGEPRAPEPPRPTVNHALHLSRDLVCTDCHDPKETGTPTLPESTTTLSGPSSKTRRSASISRSRP